MQIICNKKKFITYIAPILTKLKVTSGRRKRIHILHYNKVQVQEMHIIYFIKTGFCIKVARISVKKQPFAGIFWKTV